MRMEFADDIADGARGFLVLRAGGESQLAHGVHDTALYRLQAIAQMRQRSIQNDVHRVVKVGAFGEGLERFLLYTFEIEFLIFHVR